MATKGFGQDPSWLAHQEGPEPGTAWWVARVLVLCRRKPDGMGVWLVRKEVA